MQQRDCVESDEWIATLLFSCAEQLDSRCGCPLHASYLYSLQLTREETSGEIVSASHEP
jgi:hypothetical protein